MSDLKMNEFLFLIKVDEKDFNLVNTDSMEYSFSHNYVKSFDFIDVDRKNGILKFKIETNKKLSDIEAQILMSEIDINLSNNSQSIKNTLLDVETI